MKYLLIAISKEGHQEIQDVNDLEIAEILKDVMGDSGYTDIDVIENICY